MKLKHFFLVLVLFSFPLLALGQTVDPSSYEYHPEECLEQGALANTGLSQNTEPILSNIVDLTRPLNFDSCQDRNIECGDGRLLEMFTSGLGESHIRRGNYLLGAQPGDKIIDANNGQVLMEYRDNGSGRSYLRKAYSPSSYLRMYIDGPGARTTATLTLPGNLPLGGSNLQFKIYKAYLVFQPTNNLDSITARVTVERTGVSTKPTADLKETCTEAGRYVPKAGVSISDVLGNNTGFVLQVCEYKGVALSIPGGSGEVEIKWELSSGPGFIGVGSLLPSVLFSIDDVSIGQVPLKIACDSYEVSKPDKIQCHVEEPQGLQGTGLPLHYRVRLEDQTQSLPLIQGTELNYQPPQKGLHIVDLVCKAEKSGTNYYYYCGKSQEKAQVFVAKEQPKALTARIAQDKAIIFPPDDKCYTHQDIESYIVYKKDSPEAPMKEAGTVQAQALKDGLLETDINPRTNPLYAIQPIFKACPTCRDKKGKRSGFGETSWEPGRFAVRLDHYPFPSDPMQISIQYDPSGGKNPTTMRLVRGAASPDRPDRPNALAFASGMAVKAALAMQTAGQKGSAVRFQAFLDLALVPFKIGKTSSQTGSAATLPLRGVLGGIDQNTVWEGFEAVAAFIDPLDPTEGPSPILPTHYYESMPSRMSFAVISGNSDLGKKGFSRNQILKALEYMGLNPSDLNQCPFNGRAFECISQDLNIAYSVSIPTLPPLVMQTLTDFYTGRKDSQGRTYGGLLQNLQTKHCLSLRSPQLYGTPIDFISMPTPQPQTSLSPFGERGFQLQMENIIQDQQEAEGFYQWAMSLATYDAGRLTQAFGEVNDCLVRGQCGVIDLKRAEIFKHLYDTYPDTCLLDMAAQGVTQGFTLDSETAMNLALSSTILMDFLEPQKRRYETAKLVNSELAQVVDSMQFFLPNTISPNPERPDYAAEEQWEKVFKPYFEAFNLARGVEVVGDSLKGAFMMMLMTTSVPPQCQSLAFTMDECQESMERQAYSQQLWEDLLSENTDPTAFFAGQMVFLFGSVAVPAAAGRIGPTTRVGAPVQITVPPSAAGGVANEMRLAAAVAMNPETGQTLGAVSAVNNATIGLGAVKRMQTMANTPPPQALAEALSTSLGTLWRPMNRVVVFAKPGSPLHQEILSARASGQPLAEAVERSAIGRGAHKARFNKVEVEELTDGSFRVTFRKPDPNPEVPNPTNYTEWSQELAGTTQVPRNSPDGAYYQCAGVDKSFPTLEEAINYVNRKLAEGKGFFPKDDHSVGKTLGEYLAGEPAGIEGSSALRAEGGFKTTPSSLFKLQKEIEMSEQPFVVVFEARAIRRNVVYFDPLDPGRGLYDRGMIWPNEVPLRSVNSIYIRSSGEATFLQTWDIGN